MPIILKTAHTNEFIQLNLHAFLVPNMMHPVFISWKALMAVKPEWGILSENSVRKMVVHLENEEDVFVIKGP
jgi:hypothetical protein